MLGAGILNSALPFLLYAYAAQSLGAGFLSVADAVTPVWGAAVGWLWLRDTMPWTRSAGLGVALLGIAILVWDRLTFDPGGTGPVVLAAVAAPHSSQLDQAIPRGRQSPTERHGQHGCRHPGLMPLAQTKWPAAPVSTEAGGATVLLAVFCTGAAYLIFFD